MLTSIKIFILGAVRPIGRLAQFVERRTREHVSGHYRCGFESPAGQLKLLIVFRMRRLTEVPCDAEHVKEPGGILSSFVLYPCTNRLLGEWLKWATGSDDK